MVKMITLEGELVIEEPLKEDHIKNGKNNTEGGLLTEDPFKEILKLVRFS